MKNKIIILVILSAALFCRTAIAANMELPELPKDDDAFLDAIERQAFEYFWNEANPDTGIVYDSNNKRMGGSIASVGFALSAICVADSRGWISHNDAYNRVLATMKSFHRDPENPDDFCVEGYCGLFFHFVDVQTGKWYKNVDCVSTADTADLIAGVITCMEYFKGTEVEKLGDDIARACEWDSFLRDNNNIDHEFIAMGCIPPGLKSASTNEKGFFGRYYGYMDNSFLIYILGIASPTHPIPVSSWYASQSTYNRQRYNDKTVIVPRPSGLAFHYYQHCWLDLRNKKDQLYDYFNNSLLAVLAQQEYCRGSDNYENGLWGISSSLSPRGYESMGAPFADAYENGTITPHAIAGGILFTPKESLDALKYLAAYHSDMVMGKYGFTDAFNEKRDWSSRDYIGIDEGVIVLMIENFRTGLVWKYFMRNKYIQEAMKKIGFVGIIEDFENDPGKGAYSTYAVSGGNVAANISTDIFMEGKRSLRIDAPDHKGVKLDMKPDLKDFSDFKFMSLWTKNSRDIKVCITDKFNRMATLDYNCYLESAGWRRYFYSIDRATDINLKNISNVAIIIVPADDDANAPIYIDGIELTYETVNSNPPNIGKIDLSPLDNLSICKVSFNSSGDVHRYDIRYSREPILNQSDFQRCPSLDNIFFSSGTEKEEFFLPAPGEGKYYVGVQAIDSMAQRSRIESAGPVTIKGGMSFKVLDDFEGPGLSSRDIVWPNRSAYTITISGERAAQGKKSLKVEYYKLPTDVWDYLELAFKKPMDVRPFRYLKMSVFGDDAIIAKLYNSKNSQEEIGVLRPLKKGEWNELSFDIGAMSGEKIDKSRVTKILLFVAPGRAAAGTVYLDNIRLDN